MKKLRITVEGRAFDVTVEVLEDDGVVPQVRSALPVVTSGAASAEPAKPALKSSPAQSSPSSSAKADGATSGTEVLSQLSGVVVSVDVAVGSEVTAGQQLLTIEAMKMNTYVLAPTAGKVIEVLKSKGNSVVAGDLLVRLA